MNAINETDKRRLFCFWVITSHLSFIDRPCLHSFQKHSLLIFDLETKWRNNENSVSFFSPDCRLKASSPVYQSVPSSPWPYPSIMTHHFSRLAALTVSKSLILLTFAWLAIQVIWNPAITAKSVFGCCLAPCVWRLIFCKNISNSHGIFRESRPQKNPTVGSFTALFLVQHPFFKSGHRRMQ